MSQNNGEFEIHVTMLGVVVSNYYFQYFVLVEGVAEEEEVDDQLLWNLQILSEVRTMYVLSLIIAFVRTVARAKRYCLIAHNGLANFLNKQTRMIVMT